MVKDKKTAEFIHAKRRLSERHGLSFTKELQKQLMNKIKSRQVILLNKPSLRVRIYEINIKLPGNWLNEGNEEKFKVVYDKYRQQIVSFLPI